MPLTVSYYSVGTKYRTAQDSHSSAGTKYRTAEETEA